MIEEQETKKTKKKQYRKGFGLLETIIIIILTAIASGIASGIIIYNTYSNNTKVSYSNLTTDEDLQEFLEVYDSVLNDYYEDVDKKAMLEAAISGMLEYLGDSYTTYMNESETNILSQTLNGTYKGIGVSFKDKTIIKVYKNTPAEKAGLKSGDIFKKINGDSCEEWDDTKISSTIKAQDKKVSITIQREGNEIEYELNLDTLNVPSISYEVKNDNIGYIYISTFSTTLASQIKEALEDLESQKINSLIIDVRDNAGGYLVSASDVASMLIEKGKNIYSLQSGTNIETYIDQTEENRKYPIVVLINENSASASEILAAALKESYGATLVGTKSYGKGKVQQTKSLSDGSMVKYTTAKWLTPSGNCIDKLGITPDIEINVEYIYEGETIVDYIDKPLEKALEILSK